MLNSKNHKLLKKNGLIVFLFCEMDELVKRLQQDYKRPPLTSQKTPQKELEQLWKERKIMYYRTADICLQTDKNNQIIRKKADVLLELLKSID